MCHSSGPSNPHTPGTGLTVPPAQNPPASQSGSHAHLPHLAGLGVLCLKGSESNGMVYISLQLMEVKVQKSTSVAAQAPSPRVQTKIA